MTPQTAAGVEISYTFWRSILVLTSMDVFDASVVLDTTQVSGGAAGVLHGTKMILITNSPAITKQMLLGALTQATFSGYASQALTWSAATRNEVNNMSTRSSLVSWIPTDGVTPNVITGYAIVDSTGAVLLAVEMLPAPVSLVDAFSNLGIVSEYSPAAPSQGQCTVIT
jgi:hypothetical protein